MSKREALERMTQEGAAVIKRQEKEAERAEAKKAKVAFWNEQVACVLCHVSVVRKATVLLNEGPFNGPACKKHPGVGT